MPESKAGDPKKIKRLGKELAKELQARSSALRKEYDKPGTSDKDKEILHLKISIIEDLVDDLGFHICSFRHGAIAISKTKANLGCPTGTCD